MSTDFRVVSQLLSRRDALWIGMGAFGLSLPLLLQRDASAVATGAPVLASPRRSARAKSVIILYLSGGPSQLDTWDMKPRASEEIRGTFRPISTNVPGIQVCEHFPRMARLADKYTIVRSMNHTEPDHLRAGYWVMTGGRLTRPITAFSGMERTDRPHAGGVVAKLRPATGLPSFVVVPEFVSPREVARPGQHAGFLGAGFDPYAIQSDPSRRDYNAGPLAQIGGTSADRLRRRRRLLHELEFVSPALHGSAPDVQDIEATRANAFDLVTSAQAQHAFDISGEPAATRAKYGNHAFGQSALVARRLVEAGVRLVQVNFPRHDDQPTGQGYDSHSVPPYPPHLSYCKDYLLPTTDAAFSALIEDLADRGMLEETLVVMMGEFGRTPQFNSNGGRDHWPGCYSLVVAGGGTVSGAIYGESDPTASTPVRDPVSPDDLLATIYYLLGIDHQSELHDMDNRPIRVSEGRPVPGLIA